MSGRIDRPEFRFGRTVVTVAIGDLLGQEAEGVVFAANCRGVMGSLATPGLTGLRSLGGSEIEREAMVRAPLDLGSAILTSATGLEERGARAVKPPAIRLTMAMACRSTPEASRSFPGHPHDGR